MAVSWNRIVFFVVIQHTLRTKKPNKTWIPKRLKTMLTVWSFLCSSISLLFVKYCAISTSARVLEEVWICVFYDVDYISKWEQGLPFSFERWCDSVFVLRCEWSVRVCMCKCMCNHGHILSVWVCGVHRKSIQRHKIASFSLG